MKHFFYYCLLLLSFSVRGQATNIDIGTGTSNSDNSPIQRNSNYSASELLYLSSEINASGNLTGLGFYKASGATTVTIDSVYIYLKTTTATALTASSGTAGYTLAYRGAFPNTTNNGWVTVNFNMISNFNYNTAAGNLSILLVRPYQAATTSRPYYRYTTIAGSAYNAWYKDNTSPWSGTFPEISAWRPNIRLVMTAAPACAVPAALTATSVTGSSASLNWAYTGTPLTYQIKYGVTGFNVNTAGTSIFTPTKPYTLNPPLTPGTSYDYYVRTVCAAGDTSAWSAVASFTTLTTCPAPTSPTATSVTGTSAVLNWINTGTPLTYQIKYGLNGFNVNTGGTSIFTTTKPYTLNPPLAPLTAYSYYVRIVCSAGDTSAWSPVTNFTTLCNSPAILSKKDSFRCGTGVVMLEAATTSGATLKWYAASTGGTALATGNVFTTPSISTTTNYYVEASVGTYSSVGSAGRNDYTGNASATPNNTGQGIRFNASANFNLDSVAVWVTNDTGTIVIRLQNAANTVLANNTYTFAGTGATAALRKKVYLPVNYSITAGNNYKILAMPGTTVPLSREQTINPPFATYAIPGYFATVSSWVNGAGNTANYYYFYNFYLSAGTSCASPRETVVATIRPVPAVGLGNDTTICPGASYTFNAGNTGATYLWSPDGQATQTITTNAAGTYSVNVTVNGCSGKDTIVIIPGTVPVNNLPDTTDLCEGDIATLNAGNAGCTFSWEPGNATTQSINVTSGGNYTVDIKSIHGCQISSSTYVSVHPLPVDNLINDTAICNSAIILLDAGNPGYSYVWNTGATTQTIDAADSGTYFVTVTTPYSCVNADTTHIAYLLEPRTGGFSFIPKFFEELGKVEFSPLNPVNVNSYEWDFGDGSPLVTAINPTHIYAASGEYNVTLKVYNECTDFSRSQKINVGLPTGTVNISKDDLSLSIYPNPARSMLNISNGNADYEMQDVMVFNAIGAMIYHHKAGNKSMHRLSVENFSPGIYFVRVLTDKGFINRQVQIVK